MDITIEVSEPFEIVDLGDAKEQTRQVWFGTKLDNEFGWGRFPG